MGATTCNVHGGPWTVGRTRRSIDPAGDGHGSCSNSATCHAETSPSSASLPDSIHCFVDNRGHRLVDLLPFCLPHKYCQFVIMQALSFLQDASVVASNLLAYYS